MPDRTPPWLAGAPGVRAVEHSEYQRSDTEQIEVQDDLDVFPDA